MSEVIIKVPDIGNGKAEVIEICVNTGDSIEAEDSLIILESDKASMDIPAPTAGKVGEILLKLGDSVSEGNDILKVSSENTEQNEAPRDTSNHEVKSIAPEPPASIPTKHNTTASRLEKITVPDIGSEGSVIIEVCVTVGDTIPEDAPLIILESDKATMEVPSPMAGLVKSIKASEGDKMNQGDLILELEVSSDITQTCNTDPIIPTTVSEPTKLEPSTHVKNPYQVPSIDNNSLDKSNSELHAGPAVRKLAREFGVDLALIKGTGPRDRIIKEDVQSYVKLKLSQPMTSSGITGSGIPQLPSIDFSQWGDVEEKPLNRLRTIAAKNFQRSWLNVPHVTQFDQADITELEAFRKAQKTIAENRGTKLTPLPFIIKACAYILKELPQFLASLSPDGESLIYKKYINIGIAVDTPDGLMVPVIKSADKKGLWELAEECLELAGKARNKKLKPPEMQGGCFTISSLGSIGGTAFTPIVNAPEVAILGLSKARMQPIWDGNEFSPRLLLPVSLSYDHRAINGAEAARFTTMLNTILGDIRNMLL